MNFMLKIRRQVCVKFDKAKVLLAILTLLSVFNLSIISILGYHHLLHLLGCVASKNCLTSTRLTCWGNKLLLGRDPTDV
jgi:hypothetical protein